MDSVQNDIFFQIKGFSVSMKRKNGLNNLGERDHNYLVASGHLCSLSIFLVLLLPVSSSLNPGAENIAINNNLNLIIWLFSISLDYVDSVI